MQGIKRVPVQLSTKAYGLFFKTKKVIIQGDLITEENCEPVFQEIRTKHIFAIREKADCLGQETLMTLAQGTILSTNLIRPIPIIRKGDNVLIILKKQNIELKFKGEALQDGNKQRKIRVRSFWKDQRILEGEVVDSKNVEVKLLD
jgi:flagella basal body P-ring formation protein FlgA